MKNYIIITFLFVSSIAVAQTPKFAVGGGLLFNKPDFKTGELSEEVGAPVSVDEEMTNSFNVGVRGLYPLNENFSLRSGLFLQEKSGEIDIEVGGLNASMTPKILEIAIPLNAQYKFHEKFSAYGGYIVDFPLNTYCKAGGVVDDCSVTEDGKVTHNLNAGGAFHLNEKIDLELSYQHPMKAVLDDFKIYSWLLQVFVNL